MRLRCILATLVAFSFAIWPLTASATLLFSGGETTDFICASGGGCGTTTVSGTFRSGWARGAPTAWGNAVTDPPQNRLTTPLFDASASLWVHAQYCNVYNQGCSGNETIANTQMLRLMDSDANATLIVRGTGTPGSLKISSRTAAGAMTDLVTCPMAIAQQLAQFDLYVNYSSSGEIALYSNSVRVCDFTGDLTNGDGATTLNSVEFSSPSSGQNGAWSEVIVATTDTRAMARFTANTAANGNTTGFSGTNICSSIWNAFTSSDTIFGYSDTPNVLQECTINSAIPAGAYKVLGLVMNTRASVGTSGPQHFDFATRVNGTDYLSGDYAPTNSFSNIGNYIQAVNPATSAPWTLSDFQSGNFNIGLETKP